MDLFGNKRAVLENLIKSQAKTIARQQASELALHRKLRDIDQLIYAMGQCSSWEEMRPIFAKLKHNCDVRMIEESGRIKRVLIPEMQKAYGSDPTSDLVLKEVSGSKHKHELHTPLPDSNWKDQT